MDKKRVVITGLGVVAPNGTGKDDFWKANKDGISGIDFITRFDASNFDSRIAGQIESFIAADYLTASIVNRTDRFTQLGLASAIMAHNDSRLNLEIESRDRIATIFGSGFGGVIYYEEQILRGVEKGAHRTNPACIPRITPNAVSSQVAIYFNLLGSSMMVANACASGAVAVGEAYRKIQHNEADLIFAGGTEAPLTQFCFGAYDAMRVLSKRNENPQKASCPFDRKRDGFVLGEGAATLILEELEHALSRGADIYAEITGYCSNSGAYDMTIPRPDAQDVMTAMQNALSEARIKPQEIDYINAHGTSTRQNDKVETEGIKGIFSQNAYKIPVSSTKSMIGHTIGASGAIEAAVCCLSIQDQLIPPTVNYQDPDPECDLDYVPNKARKAKIKTVLSNSFGFGSNNTCLIFRRYDG